MIAGPWDDVPARVWSGLSYWIEGAKAEENVFSENDYLKNISSTYLEWLMFVGASSGFDWHWEGSEGPNSKASPCESGQWEAEHRHHRSATKRR